MSSYQITVSPVINSITVEDSSPTVRVNGTVSTAVGAAGGDLAGNYPNPTVDGLQGRAVASTAPSDGQALAWNNALSRWEPTTVAAGVPDGDKGDITVSGGGTVWSIDSGAVDQDALASNSVGTGEIKDKNVTFGKLQDIPTQTLVGRATIGTGTAENIGLSSDFGIDPATFELYLTNRTGNSIVGRSASTAGAPADIAATADGQVLRRASGVLGFGTVATDGIANDAITYAKIQNVSATDRLLGRSSAGAGDIEEIVCTAFARGFLDDVDAAAARSTIGAAATSHTHAASDVSAAGSSGQVMFNSGGAFAGDSGMTYDSATGALTVGSLVLSNAEFITNSTNGRVEIRPAPTGSTIHGFYTDFSTANIVRLGTIRSSDNTLNQVDLQVMTNLDVSSGNAFGMASGAFRLWYMQKDNPTGTLGRLVFATTTNNADHTGCFIFGQTGAQNSANRSPASQANPMVYVYSNDLTNANDFVRIFHDQTNGTVNCGDGKLILKGASAVRIESSTGGFDLPATAGSNGQVLTTNGTNASWQTPAGGGGGVSEAFAIAMAVAL